MIVIFGRRAYGRVDASGTEYAQTTFFHLYYVPIFPLESFWVTREAGAQRVGHEIPLHGKSVLATYLRVWAPIFAVATLSGAPLVAGLPFALLLGGLSAWAWSWRSLRGDLARRRSDFNRLAFGVRCEPSVMSSMLRVQLHAGLNERWARLSPSRSPNDVAAYGAKDSGEAVTAYGLLRMAELDRGGRDAGLAAQRILLGAHDLLPADDGPYRDAAAPAVAAGVHAQVAAAAATVDARQVGAFNAAMFAAQQRTAAARIAAAPRTRARRFAVLSAAVAVASIVGLCVNAGSLRTPARGAIADVVHERGVGDYVTVTCDRVDVVGEITSGYRTTNEALLCSQGDDQHAQSIAVVADPYVVSFDGPVTGQLRSPSYQQRWWDDVVTQADHKLEPVYLQVGEPTAERVGGILSLLGLLAAAAFGFVSLRGFRRLRTSATLPPATI